MSDGDSESVIDDDVEGEDVPVREELSVRDCDFESDSDEVTDSDDVCVSLELVVLESLGDLDVDAVPKVSVSVALAVEDSDME